MIDIVFPKNNEKEFEAVAKKLGIKQLVFCYEKKGKFIGKLGKKEIIICKAGDNVRHVIEKVPTDIIFGFEEVSSKDFMHHRASGMNQVLAKLMKQKKKNVGFSFSSLLRSGKKAELAGRMMQNFMLCKKYKVEVVIASFARDPYEMRAPADLSGVFHSLGMEPGMVKKSLERFI